MIRNTNKNNSEKIENKTSENPITQTIIVDERPNPELRTTSSEVAKNVENVENIEVQESKSNPVKMESVSLMENSPAPDSNNNRYEQLLN